MGVREPAATRSAPQAELEGLTTKKARTRIAEMLAESGDLIGEPKPVRHAVKFYERGERPLEVVSSRQWFVRTLEFREELLERGRQLRWHPAYMGARYASWVEGLNGDWSLSRQRFFGVPFPVWYRARRGREPRPRATCSSPTRPACPSTPRRTSRTGSRRTSAASRAASSATPTSWTRGPRRRSPRRSPAGGSRTTDLFARVFPMDLRPQAHEIIRTWLFYTVLRVAPRARLAAVDRRRDQRVRPRPRPQEDVEVQGQRRHPDGAVRATTAPTPSGTGRRAPASASTPRSTSSR